MVGALKMMAVATVEIAAASVGESGLVAPVRELEAMPQMVGELETSGGKEAVVVDEPDESSAEVEDETVEATLTEEEIGMVANVAMEVETKVEAETVDAAEGGEEVALAQLEAATPSTEQEPGEEILAELVDAAELAQGTPDPAEEEPYVQLAPAFQEAEESLAAEGAHHGSACHYEDVAVPSEAVAEEMAAVTLTEEPESVAAPETEQAALETLGEEASTGEELEATEEATAMETPVITHALAAASTSSTLEELDLEPSTGSVVKAMSEVPLRHTSDMESAAEAMPEADLVSEEVAAPSSGLEALVAEETMAETESTEEPNPPAEELETTVQEEIPKPELLSEEGEPVPMLEETKTQDSTAQEKIGPVTRGIALK
ncbi:hypothetical protein JZ751_016488 [Albula glossodonta]|uniref:Uncharacterized protein n=1 Tax=Albula glossodonta TaxID=121402 RepID=A0A8T2NQ37_9TELE|nr:hypothetical protein JZ751_016488 [Albula glossodonta]